jgi:hypothetical protein
MLSLLLFQPDYIAKLIELGEADARTRAVDIDAFIKRGDTRRVRPTLRAKLADYVQFLRKRRMGESSTGLPSVPDS